MLRRVPEQFDEFSRLRAAETKHRVRFSGDLRDQIHVQVRHTAVSQNDVGGVHGQQFTNRGQRLAEIIRIPFPQIQIIVRFKRKEQSQQQQERNDIDQQFFQHIFQLLPQASFSSRYWSPL